MKRSFKTTLTVLLAVIGIICCVLLYLHVIEVTRLKPIAGYLDPSGDEPFIRADLLEETLGAKGITLLHRETNESNPDAVRRMIDSGARVIVIAESVQDEDADILELTADDAITLLFVGRSPSLETLANNDKSWYLGSDSAHGGEILGGQIAADFKSGAISDLNGDQLLQVMVVGESSMIDNALKQCEHLGVYPDVLSYADENGTPLPFTAEAFADTARPEFILCNSGIEARSAHDLAAELGYFEGDNPVRIGCSAASEQGARSLLADGITDLSIPYYDVDTVTQTAAIFIENALDYKFISQGTDLMPNSDNHFIIPYQLMEYKEAA